MKQGQTIAWSEVHHGVKFNVSCEIPEGNPLMGSRSDSEILNIVAIAGSEFRKFIETVVIHDAEVVIDVEILGDWTCNALVRLGTPESPPEYCDEIVHVYDTRCVRHKDETPW